ncbi:hypothetical protein [Legionella hackeliae]|uniref:Uncharacterized protein n=1 Tax=Legionella hackeliae TaxID=449 RepID=A0A0A8UUR9_LEGHA|nr:hypothetical protein [Legionella hackeliae]KTD13828.1 hypothetical protein Lhac_0672 [Legionella hackeliae]CEK10529.1 conserved protein of unknown function [Legionella hackeliae]STX47267.1 Uncharacterised protein [Legionella hackeliae]
MNELDILMLFYNAMRNQGKSRDQLFLSMDNSAVAILAEKYGSNVTMEDVHRLTDICIANEWLERTTADPGYNFLSLTAAGLQIALAHEYS